MNHPKLPRLATGVTGIILLVLVFLTGIAVRTSVAQAPPAPPGPCVQYDPEGPYYHQIRLAHSADGLTWQTDNVVIHDHASVPSIVNWKGTLWLYAGDAVQNWLIVMRQEGSTWWETRTQIDGFDPTYAVDPDVVVLPDGRLRLYFLDIRTLAPSNVPSIYSAVTSDGVRFKLEEGIRFQSTPPGPGTDPDVVQAADGSWWIFLLHGAGALVGHSTDGLTFKQVGLTKIGAMSDTVLLDNGTLRQYHTPPGAILSQVSTDGLTWDADAGDRLTGKVGHPTVTRMTDGSWLMAYVLMVSPGGQPAK